MEDREKHQLFFFKRKKNLSLIIQQSVETDPKQLCACMRQLQLKYFTIRFVYIHTLHTKGSQAALDDKLILNEPDSRNLQKM